jgi:hypothetical protein
MYRLTKKGMKSILIPGAKTLEQATSKAQQAFEKKGHRAFAQFLCGEPKSRLDVQIKAGSEWTAKYYVEEAK